MITIAQRLLGPTNSVPTNTQATNSLTVREFFVDIPTQTSGLLEQIIPMYLYQQYADDSDLQAFVSTFNTLAQGYLSWFTDFYQATPLGFTHPPIYPGHYWTGLLQASIICRGP